MAKYSSAFTPYIGCEVSFKATSSGLIIVDIDTEIGVISEQVWKLREVGDNYIKLSQKKSDDPKILNQKVHKYLPIDNIQLIVHGADWE